MARALKFGAHVRELRIHLCQKSEPSRGARDFITSHYITLKKSNPNFPILIRECNGVQPKLWARYDGGQENSISLTNMKSDDILKQVEAMVKSG